MELKNLGDLVTVISTHIHNPSTSGFERFVGLEHYDSGEPKITRYGSTKDLESSVKHFVAGDILVARRNVYLKRAGVVDFEGVTSGDSIVLRVKDERYKDVLPFVLNTDDFWDYAEQNSDGTMSKRLAPDVLLEYEFELPPLEEQRILADKLWAAYRLKDSYKKLLTATQEMVKSQFIEMFGDAKKVKLGELATFVNGSAFKPEEWSESGLPIVRIQNLTGSGDVYNRYNGDTTKKVIIEPGDILISWSATLGVYIWTGEKALLNQHIFRADIDKEKVDKDFFIYTVQAELNIMGENAHGSTMKHIVKKDFDNTLVAYPSLAEQRRFSVIYKQADKSEFELRKSIEAIDQVIKSLINN